MVSVRYSLRDKHAKRKSTVRVSVTYDGNRLLFCPGYSINPVHWESGKGMPKPVKGSHEIKALTNCLKELDLTIQEIYDELSHHWKVVVPPELLRHKILQILKPEKYGQENANQITLLDFFDQFIRDCERGVRLKDNQTRIEENTIKTYRTTRLHFANFQKSFKRKFLLTDFNQDLHDEFSNYLIEGEGLSKNAHSKYIMVLSQVVKYAVKKKFIASSKISEIEFRTSREETDNIYLTESEIQLLMDLKEFKNKGEEYVRDIFVLGCYTGLRFGNYSNINLDYLKDEILTTIQQKTKKKVTIPIHPCVRMIIDKYKGTLPPCPTNQEFNRTLKELGQRITELNVPFSKQITRNRKVTIEETMKWQKLMTHTARRSFCTNMYLMGVPVPTIMAISGHRLEKTFRTYIKASGAEHAKILKTYWEGQEAKTIEKAVE